MPAPYKSRCTINFFPLEIAVQAAVAVLLSSVSFAGDYHIKGTLVCSDCHTMHYSESHDYSGGTPPGGGRPDLSGGPTGKLLRRTKEYLCLACHDGQTFAPDVKGADTNGTYVRAGGAVTDGGSTYADDNGHTIGGTLPPLGDWVTDGLLCQDCHETHGNAYYRNLKENVGSSTNIKVTYMTGTDAAYNSLSDPKPSIQQANYDLGSENFDDHYSASNIKYRQNSASSGGIDVYGLSHWCIGCHDNYSDSPGGHSNNHNLPSPSTMANRTDGTWFENMSSRVPVISPGAAIPGTVGGSDNLPFCGSCHKAHGSQNVNGELWDDGGTADPEDGADGDTCLQCHA